MRVWYIQAKFNQNNRGSKNASQINKLILNDGASL